MTITEGPAAGAPPTQVVARAEPGLEGATPPGTTAEPARAGTGGSRGSRSWWANLAVALVALSPFFVGSVQILRRGFPPGALFGDRAILALTAGDAFRGPVLLGPYSRFFWHHPGPLYFYVLDGWGHVFGGSTTSLVLGATAINVAGAAGILYLAYRRGGRALLVWASLLLSAYLVAIDPVPFDIWNPSVTLLPFVALLLLAWSIACRDWWAIPWFAVIASFVVQTHVGLAPPVAMAVVFCATVAWWQHRRALTPMSERERRTVARAALVGLGLTVLAWLPPFVQEFTGREGNLGALVRFFAHGGQSHPWSDGFTHTGLQSTLMARSLFEPIALRTDAHQGLGIAVVVTALAFAAAFVLARRTRSRDTQLLLGLVAVELLVGVYAVTRIEDAIQFYLAQWVSAVGFVLWLAVGRSVIEAVRVRAEERPPSRTVVRVGAVFVALLLCAGAVRAFPSGAALVNEDLNVPNNRALFGYVPARQLLAATARADTVVLRPDSITSWEVLAADALLLRQHGREVRIVSTKETRLLFDDVILVPRSMGEPGRGRVVLAFREQTQGGSADATHVADQGLWTIETLAPR